MWLAGQWFGADVVARIDAAVASDRDLTRSGLSRLVCQWLDWRAPDGRLRDASCRRALIELECRGVVRLPAVAPSACGFNRARSVRRDAGAVELEPECEPVAVVSCSLADLGPVELVRVTGSGPQASAAWNQLMNTEHYLGAPYLRGAQMRYLIRSPRHGVLGGISFDASSRTLTSRDKWIGWSTKAREVNLSKVVCNSRFLIASGVQVPNLASHVLSRALRTLRPDWARRYGYEPVLVETFIDPGRFAGTCYRAANWVRVGATAGRGDGFANGGVSTGPKDVYCYPLTQDFQDVLRAEPTIELCLGDQLSPGGDWVEREFARVRLPDRRLRSRLGVLARDFYAQPGEQIPAASGGSPAKSKGAYRFFHNDHVDMETLLTGHVEATARRVSEHKVVLAVQDTTSLNYSTHTSATGFGPISASADSAVGLIVHDTLAFDTSGTPLGLLDVQAWDRPEKARTKTEKNKQKKVPLAQKESFKWVRSYRAAAKVAKLCPDTQVVSVGDREADIHELFVEAQSQADTPDVLIRSARNRARRIQHGDTSMNLWEAMSTRPAAGEYVLDVPRAGSRAARIASMDVRYAQVKLLPPGNKNIPAYARGKPVDVWVVYATEVDAPETVASPLEWMLITTVAVNSLDDALERLHWYTLRWGIEVYHKVMKSGCRIEDRLLGDADSTKACLAIDMVVAWRIFYLTKQARATPNVPADVFLETDQWRALMAVTRPNEPPTDQPPTLREATRLIASLGGFLGRKGDGEPGTVTLWRGLQRLDGIVIGYRAARTEFNQVLQANQRSP